MQRFVVLGRNTKMGEETLTDKIVEIRARHEVDTKIATVLNPELPPTWTLAGWMANDDRATLLAEDARRRAEIEKLTRELDEARAEVERLREVLEIVRIDGPDAQGLVWASFTRQGGVRVNFVTGHKERMVSQALLEFEQIRRKALEDKP